MTVAMTAKRCFLFIMPFHLSQCVGVYICGYFIKFSIREGLLISRPYQCWCVFFV